MSICTFVVDLAVSWQAAGKQEDMPSCYNIKRQKWHLEYGSVHSCKLIGQLQVSKSLRDLLAEVSKYLVTYNFYKQNYNLYKL